MKKLQFRSWTVPLALLALCLVSFGLLIPWLGFYWDDWPVIYIGRVQGARGFLNFYQYDRPFSAWTYLLSMPVLGDRPLAWQLFTLLLRWLTILGMWWSLRKLWPRHTRQVTWMAFLFAIYPVFTQQPIAVAFSQHWTVYALFFLSLGAMIQSIRAPRWYWPLTFLALAAAAVHLLTMEYFLGLELLRPLVLWFLSQEQELPTRQRAAQTLKRWLPYLLLLVAYVIWRIFFMKLAAEDPNSPALLMELFSQPLPALLTLLQNAAQDTINTLVAAWYQTLQPAQINLTDRFFMFSEGLTVLSGLGVILYLMHYRPSEPEDHSDLPGQERTWVVQALLLGFFATVLGPLPVWVTGKQAVVGLYGSRFALASMFGASILIVAILEAITPRQVAKVVLVGALVGLSVGFHLRNANEYRWIWTEQTRFYWEMNWRAPYLEPQTAIFSEGELFKYVGDYSTSTALNLLYPEPPDTAVMGYWFIDLFRNFQDYIPDLLEGIPIQRSFRSFRFKGESHNSLVISQNDEGHCLWVVTPDDALNPDVSTVTRTLAPISNLARIQAAAPSGYPPADIFGREPAHTWCYYYQKAELARQYRDWQQVAKLGNQAQRQGLEPNSWQEWLPFVEGYARSGDLKTAIDLTETIYKKSPKLQRMLCTIWQRVDAAQDATPDSKVSAEAALGELGCAP